MRKVIPILLIALLAGCSYKITQTVEQQTTIQTGSQISSTNSGINQSSGSITTSLNGSNSGTILYTFDDIPYKNGKFLPKQEACKIGNVVSTSGIVFSFILPSESTNIQGSNDGFFKQRNIITYLVRVGYNYNNKYITEHELYQYDCATQQTTQRTKAEIYTGVRINAPSDSTAYPVYVDNKQVLIYAGYEGPAQYFLITKSGYKLLNPKEFTGRSAIEKEIINRLNKRGVEPNTETLDPSSINNCGYMCQMSISIKDQVISGKILATITLQSFEETDGKEKTESFDILIDMVQYKITKK